jgi:23S rRNA (pseudouridine1915-N3)-methyltransferase
MRVLLAGVGALRGPGLREAADAYAARVARYVEFAEREVREAGRVADIASRQREEARRLTAVIPAGSVVVALERTGEPWSSRRLAERLERWRLEARPVAFALGGSTGLDPAFVTAAAGRWSLGPLTLPHELARVVVLEQLYRAFTILRGEPYHKGD